MTAKIPLQNGEYAIVDKEDYERCMEYVWTLRNMNSTSEIVSRKQELNIKNFILKIQRNDRTTIVNRNKDIFDNRKSNLEEVLITERSRLRRGNKGSSSKYKGVSYDKSRNKWSVKIIRCNKTVFSGRFDDEKEAALAYNENILKIDGDNAFLNDIHANNNTSDLDNNSIGKQRRKIKSKPTPYTSKYKGVYYESQRDKFVSRLVENYESHFLGRFNCEKEAAKAYDKKAYELYGNKAILNFPELINEYEEEVL